MLWKKCLSNFIEIYLHKKIFYTYLHIYIEKVNLLGLRFNKPCIEQRQFVECEFKIVSFLEN